MSNDISVRFSLEDSKSFEFPAHFYEFKFLGKRLPSMTTGWSGEPVVPINETFAVAKSLDDATITLSTLCARGVVVPTVEVMVDFLLEGSLTEGKMTYRMSDVRIHSHHSDGSHEGLWENIHLSFSKIEWLLEFPGKVVSGSNSLDPRGDRGLYL